MIKINQTQTPVIIKAATIELDNAGINKLVMHLRYAKIGLAADKYNSQSNKDAENILIEKMISELFA